MKHALLTSLVVACLLAAAAAGSGELAATPVRSCESLASLTLHNTTITLAQTVDRGAFRPPPAIGGAAAPLAAAQAFRELPAFSDSRWKTLIPFRAVWNYSLAEPS